MLGEKVEYSQSFAPNADGQILLVTVPWCVALVGSTVGRPVERLMPLAQLAPLNGLALINSPVLRSRM